MSEEQQKQAFDQEAYRAGLKELQVLDFALVELNLYLNTHPGDLQAIQQFNQLAQKRQAVAQQFELQYGPLVHFGHSYSRYPWQWNEMPWPWQV
ncbi:spore coat protein CotJB [Paenibacillus albicereus]|uniref:Spore coat protein CotJB n=1 Tax=Paenibacillus albicereus TaxID=2726185 RepID=A0A6H2H160_9BACL|nr:spore coat protein CotJB [Paenibacillus albicereus]QJC53088.1 spore coat protein CotJB [Paenibacillus albicereus]